jgi:hypothetical protein
MDLGLGYMFIVGEKDVFIIHRQQPQKLRPFLLGKVHPLALKQGSYSFHPFKNNTILPCVLLVIMKNIRA